MARLPNRILEVVRVSETDNDFMLSPVKKECVYLFCSCVEDIWPDLENQEFGVSFTFSKTPSPNRVKLRLCSQNNQRVDLYYPDEHQEPGVIVYLGVERILRKFGGEAYVGANLHNKPLKIGGYYFGS